MLLLIKKDDDSLAPSVPLVGFSVRGNWHTLMLRVTLKSLACSSLLITIVAGRQLVGKPLIGLTNERRHADQT